MQRRAFHFHSAGVASRVKQVHTRRLKRPDFPILRAFCFFGDLDFSTNVFPAWIVVHCLCRERIKETEAANRPGPGAYQSSDFRPQLGKDITFGRQFRPAGWTSKIKEITRFSWELDSSEDEECNRKRLGHFQAPLQRFAKSRVNRRNRRPSSAPPSSRFRRACARGRRLDRNGGRDGGGQRKHSHEFATGRTPHDRPRSIADVVKEDGRRRRAQVVKAAANVAGVAPKAALMGSSPQRPPDAKPTPGPASYRPVTRDEAARNGKVVSVGGKSRRELFPASPDTPGPECYIPEIVQGPALNQESRRRRRISMRHAAVRGTPSPWSTNNTHDSTTILKKRPAPSGSSPSSSTAVPRRATQVGTFGSSERFPKDTTPRPGVGEYDLRAAERAAGGASTAIPITIGRKAGGVPYNPALNRYLRADNLETPSAHAYRSEPAIGGGGKDGLGGHAPAPPAWSFGGKRPSPRPPDGPGPGRFRPAYNNGADPCCSPTAAARFGAGREGIPGSVSGVPWVEVEERAARGDGGGGDAKIYLPERTRMGGRAFMRSRPLPRPGR